MASNEHKQTEQKDGSKPKTNPGLLDLAFAMDCTGSMGSYIRSAQQNIRKIVEEIIAKEHADTRLALVEYRDHPPQDRTFVTRPHDFTSSVRQMKEWLDGCSASGGGDTPEAVADALHQVLKLSWRDDAVKICVFISDAPPHGLQPAGDSFPNGCPDGIDPMVVANQIAEKGIIMYMVGCEPSIVPYRDWFMAISHLTGGQYVPLRSSSLLAKVIIGGAQEEISLQELMAEVNQEVMAELGQAGELDEDKLTNAVHYKLNARGATSKQLMMNNAELPAASAQAQCYSKMPNIQSQQQAFKPAPAPSHRFGGFGGAPSSARGFGFGGAPPPSGAGMMNAMPMGGPPMMNPFAMAPPPPPGAGMDMFDLMDGMGPAPMDLSSDADVVVGESRNISMQQAQRMVSQSIMTNQLQQFKKK